MHFFKNLSFFLIALGSYNPSLQASQGPSREVELFASTIKSQPQKDYRTFALVMKRTTCTIFGLRNPDPRLTKPKATLPTQKKAVSFDLKHNTENTFTKNDILPSSQLTQLQPKSVLKKSRISNKQEQSTVPGIDLKINEDFINRYMQQLPSIHFFTSKNILAFQST